MPSTGPGIEVPSDGSRIIDGSLLSAFFTSICLLNPTSCREPHTSVAMLELCHLNINTETHIEAWCTGCKDVGGKNGAPEGSLTHRCLYRKECGVEVCPNCYYANILNKYAILKKIFFFLDQLPRAELKYKCKNSCDTIRLA